jgi:hypothetical protein
VAFVLLDRFVSPNMAAVVAALRVRHPELPVELMTGKDSVSGAAGTSASLPLIRCGDQFVVVMAMPAPIPQDQGLWSRTAHTWPEGKATAERHQGHLIVSVLGQSKQQLPTARVITAVIGALVAVTPECRAVVWRSKVARSAALWQEMSRRSFAPFPDCPFTLWLDVLPFRSGAVVGAVTMGLSAFAGREIEFETGNLDLPTVIDKVAGLAAYLLEHGAVVKDGDTFGGDEREHFRVHYETSARFAGLPVFFCSTPLAS